MLLYPKVYTIDCNYCTIVFHCWLLESFRVRFDHHFVQVCLQFEELMMHLSILRALYQNEGTLIVLMMPQRQGTVRTLIASFDQF